MKGTGMVRKIDELGRIVLPIEMRRTFGIGEKDPVEIYVKDDMIVLRKYQETCVFCDSTKNIITYSGKNICTGCISSIKSL